MSERHTKTSVTNLKSLRIITYKFEKVKILSDGQLGTSAELLLNFFTGAGGKH